MACAATCVNTSISAASLIAFYSFDSVTTDGTGTYPLSGLPSPTYVSGWIGSAISFNAANSERLSTSNLPLSGVSFSIDFWFNALNVSSGWDIPFMGQYTAQLQRRSLFLSVYNTALYMGFFADDTFGNTILSPNTWYHAAFTFDSSILQRSIYLNGILDGQGSAAGTLQSSSQGFTVGGARVGGRVPTFDSYYTGYIDHVTISTRVKSACEIYLAANLACYFTFNTASPPLDSSASGLTAVNTGASLVIGVISQALQFSSATTYITVSGISALKSASNSAFSISMWVRPTTVSGGATLIHASTLANGQSSVQSSSSALLLITFDCRSRNMSDDVGSDIYWTCECQYYRRQRCCGNSDGCFGAASECVDPHRADVQFFEWNAPVHQRKGSGDNECPHRSISGTRNDHWNSTGWYKFVSSWIYCSRAVLRCGG